MFQILKNNIPDIFCGCDIVVKYKKRNNEENIKILQLTDMQVIDANQARNEERLREDEKSAWKTENFDIQFANHVRSVISQAKPDLIFITGDIVYGEFDDSGKTLKRICDFFDSFKIPWAVVFGNHDNEALCGVDYQCKIFEDSKYCLFKRGDVTGNSNFTLGIAKEDSLIRTIHFLDSNGCKHTNDLSVNKVAGIYPDQLEMVNSNTEKISLAQKRNIPSFMAFHFPFSEFVKAEENAGYASKKDFYCIGVDVKQNGDDFGTKQQNAELFINDGQLLETAQKCFVDGIFVGHCHKINTCIKYKNIKFVYGLKTGQYDFHNPCQIGGTLIELNNEKFKVSHIFSLANLAPYPPLAPMFNNFFVK